MFDENVTNVDMVGEWEIDEDKIVDLIENFEIPEM
jgi:hypothetical protein